MNEDLRIVWRSHRIDTYKDLLVALRTLTDHMMAEHAGKMYDPAMMSFEVPLQMSMASKTLTDGSVVYDLYIREVL